MSEPTPEVFGPGSNAVARAILALAALGVVGAVVLSTELVLGAWGAGTGAPPEQPVPLSQEHHVGGLGSDCRYCHADVERAAFAGMPATETCVSCHQKIWNDSPMLEPVRASYRTGEPLRWRRVYDLAGYVYFDHAIHVAKGIGCESCHGRVDRMPLLWKASTIRMEWCLDCHEQPWRQIRPREHVFDMGWSPPEDQARLGRRLVHEYRVRPPRQLTSCYTCHR